MPEPISTGLAQDWIQTLWKLWSKIRQSRRAELDRMRDLFGDPELLAQRYIEPDCQRTNPADVHEDEPMRTFRQPVREYLNRFLAGEFFERDGRNTVFVLSDAGMGKTSLLMMLKLSHMLSFWPKGIDFRLLKLGETTLADLVAIQPRRTVLLLDALDEDPTAWGRIEARLEELLQATKAFRQVILTCRTQFFPKGGKVPIEAPEKVEVGGFVCNLVYLSPFDDAQVDAFLRKVYPNRLVDKLRKWISKADNQALERARELVLPMQSLRMRPMLLAHVQDLMEAKLEGWREFQVYEALVGNWLLREQRKNPRKTRKQLWDACTAVALHLQASGKRLLSEEDLATLLADQPFAEHIKVLDVGGRSLMNRTGDGSYRFAHYSIQEFLVAHRLVSKRGSDIPEKIRLTDLICNFLRSWMDEAPTERLTELTRLLPEREGFVFVLGGEYVLGANDIGKSTKPVHRVVLSPFWISKHPVTNAEYRRFLDAHPEAARPAFWNDESFNHPEQPVVGVTWEEARTYCKWAGGDLPSEAQWEAAARGIDGRRYPWGDQEPTAEFANFARFVGKTTPVGSYPAGAGPYGTLNQAGNVWEWCLDIWGVAVYKDRDGAIDPVRTSGNHAVRVVRGGSWAYPSESLRAAFRLRFGSGVWDWDLGFRVVFRVGPEPWI